MPTKIKAMPGVDLVVDVNWNPNQEQEKRTQERKEADHQFEVTSPNRVTVVIPEDQLNTEQGNRDENESFTHVQKGRNKKK